MCFSTYGNQPYTAMESNQVHHTFHWVNNNILSSSSLLQLATAERLMELFRSQQHTYPELNEKLNAVFLSKAEALHYFEWKRFRDQGAEAA
jgi:hypothetical protein